MLYILEQRLRAQNILPAKVKKGSSSNWSHYFQAVPVSHYRVSPITESPAETLYRYYKVSPAM